MTRTCRVLQRVLVVADKARKLMVLNIHTYGYPLTLLRLLGFPANPDEGKANAKQN